MNKRVGSSTVGGGWGFPTQRAGVGGDNKVRKSGPASFDPRTAPLPEQGVIERIDPDQRRRQMVWELEEDLPSPARFAQLMAEFMACAQRGDGDDELDESRLNANEKERLNRMLADEAALIEMMRRTERLRLEVRARAVSERAS
ncbi:MAG: hypothetical protein OSB21_02275 [Myxococcota bacterium]|nr:hypothetical protein [Myxococcota bacterium]